MLGNFNQTRVNTLPSNISNNWTTSWGSLQLGELLNYSWVGKRSQGSSPPTAWRSGPQVVLKRCGFPHPLQALSAAVWILFYLFFSTRGHSNQADTNTRHSQLQEIAFLNCTLFFFLIWCLITCCLSFAQVSFRIQREGWERDFLCGFHIIIRNDYIWSFYKFLIILSDWCMVICIGCLAEHSFCSVPYI